MADYLTAARPYARALFNEARDKNAFVDWQHALNGLAAIVAALSTLHVIGNPSISIEQLYTLCYDTLRELVAVKNNIEQDLQRFIHLLLFEKRLKAVSNIAQLYHELVAQHNNIIEVTVISATALTKAQQEKLVSALEKRFNSTVTIDYSHDAALVGGLIIKSDNWVFDGSIRSKLMRLTERVI